MVISTLCDADNVSQTRIGDVYEIQYRRACRSSIFISGTIQIIGKSALSSNSAVRMRKTFRHVHETMELPAFHSAQAVRVSKHKEQPRDVTDVEISVFLGYYKTPTNIALIQSFSSDSRRVTGPYTCRRAGGGIPPTGSGSIQDRVLNFAVSLHQGITKLRSAGQLLPVFRDRKAR
jgi:hypothetical protein